VSATTTLCVNCTNGNHTGSNGTPGCTGGSCACSCRGSQWNVAAVEEPFGRCDNGTPIDADGSCECGCRMSDVETLRTFVLQDNTTGRFRAERLSWDEARAIAAQDGFVSVRRLDEALAEGLGGA
jgi:hypothetical protein